MAIDLDLIREAIAVPDARQPGRQRHAAPAIVVDEIHAKPLGRAFREVLVAELGVVTAHLLVPAVAHGEERHHDAGQHHARHHRDDEHGSLLVAAEPSSFHGVLSFSLLAGRTAAP
jgi:hypothetical protein